MRRHRLAARQIVAQRLGEMRQHGKIQVAHHLDEFSAVAQESFSRRATSATLG